MNRIILIGNGFDRAHGLATSYVEFIDSFWVAIVDKIYDPIEKIIIDYEDDFIKISTHEYLHAIPDIAKPAITSHQQFLEFVVDYNEKFKLYCGAKGLTISFKNRFFKHIVEKKALQNWVDIENEYYELLKSIARGKTLPFLEVKLDSDESGMSSYIEEYDVVKLNQEFFQVEQRLEKYLIKVEQNFDKEIKKEIWKNIYSNLYAKDIAPQFQQEFRDHITDRTSTVDVKKEVLHSYSDFKSIHYMCSENKRKICLFVENYEKKGANYLEQELLSDWGLPSYFIVPNEFLFVNFNYTHIVNSYLPQSTIAKVINVHGELNNDENKMIFGYGDELAESYKEIENLNDNEYLKNAKSIRYLETANYRKIMEFAESAPFQIIIMGHSCGNSDRTLLNTLFEHRNCFSIKPYYHKIDAFTDNYNDIVRNISRSFPNKALMRDRVVNKTYCEPLIKLP